MKKVRKDGQFNSIFERNYLWKQILPIFLRHVGVAIPHWTANFGLRNNYNYFST